ncbi:MAG: glycosyltransferase [Candidatus Krumholzibacteria bacterium]|nr:glycosyltransferase [Candidatus Krumholzibacteria bacterium]
MPGPRLLMMINFFPPAGGGGVYRPLSFVRHLARAGWEITVVAPRPGEFWIEDESLVELIPQEVRVVRTPSLSPTRLLNRRGRGGRRSSSRFGALRGLSELALLPDPYVGWVPFAAAAANRLCRAERFDAIYSTSPPDSTHLAAARAAKRHRIRWVADFRDPWISLYLKDPPTPLHRFLHRRMERLVATRADEVVAVTAWQAGEIERRYGRAARLIRNGYEEEDFADELPAPGAGGPLTITHCGMLTLGRRARTFLEGLALFLEREPSARGNARAVFIGARESANEDLPRPDLLSGAVSFEGNIPHAACVERERRSDVLLLIKHDDDRYRGLVPGKLYEYIGARRPLLALVSPGEAADTIATLRRGEIAAPDDPAAVAGAIARLYRLRRDGALERSYDLSPRPELTRGAAAAELDALLRGPLAGKERS